MAIAVPPPYSAVLRGSRTRGAKLILRVSRKRPPRKATVRTRGRRRHEGEADESGAAAGADAGDDDEETGEGGA